KEYFRGDGHVFVWNLLREKQLTHFGEQYGPAYLPGFSPDGRFLIVVDADQTIRLCEIASGKERCRFPGDRLQLRDFRARQLAVSPDGRMLASVEGPSVILWDVTGRMEDGRWRPARLSADEMACLWKDLACSDALQAHKAVWALIADPDQAVSFLGKRL